MRRRALFVCFMLVACEPKKNVVEVASVPAEPAQPPPTSSPPPASSPPPLVLSQCVLHAGGGNGHSSKTKIGDGGFVETRSGNCYYGAECVRVPGNAQLGDGFVGVKCEDTHCTCSVESAVTGEKKEESFDIDEICSRPDLAKKLLVERCMAGMAPPK